MDTKLWSTLPQELIHAILKIDGRVQYKNGRYYDVNRIPNDDERYSVARPVVLKKTDILRVAIQNSHDDNGFYFEFAFEGDKELCLCYDYNFSYRNQFEICYVSFKNNGWDQTRTYL